MDHIALTFDLDWAHPAVVEDTLRILDSYGARGTFFATHKDPQISEDGHEVGLHPDFTRNTSSITEADPFGYRTRLDYGARLSEYVDMYPDATGVRTHGLVSSANLFDTFVGAGLTYASTALLPMHPGLRPVTLWNGLVQIPIYFEDDVHMLTGEPWTLDHIRVDGPGLKVFNFHPNAVFVNAELQDRIRAISAHYREPDEMRTHFNHDQETGARNLLLSILDYADQHGITPITLSEAAASLKNGMEIPCV